MHIQFSGKFNRRMVTIHPGEFYATTEDEIIATVLGSCIAVALFDRGTGVGGLNHFMLPGSLGKNQFFTSGSGKYGMYAMELLINDLLKAGARRPSLRAKVFGGGSVLRAGPAGGGKSIPQSNIDFAMEFLKTEGIPIDSSDTGGVNARKILFFPLSTQVMLKRLGTTGRSAVEHEEEEYLAKLQTNRPKSGEAEML
ncbi:MAG: chemoreceptor glutamine deamidase CheD [Spirochaetia bacterium]